MVAAMVPLGVAAAGGALVFVVMRRRGWPSLPSATVGLAMAPGVGFGLISLALFFWVLAGYPPPDRWTLAGLAGVLALALAVPVVTTEGGKRNVVAPEKRAPRATDGRGSLGGPRGARLAVLVLVVITLGLLLWTFPRVNSAQPFGSWDAKAIWNVRSLFLYRADGGLAEIYSELKYGHPDYPLLLPGSLAAQYCVLGREDLAIPQFTSLLFALASGAALFLVVARHGSITAAGVAVAVLGSTPTFWRWAFTQYADIPLSYLLLIAAASLASQLDSDQARRWPPSLAGFFLGLLTWIKNEGLVLAVLLVVAFAAVLLFAGRPGRGTLRRLLLIVGGALSPLLALVLFKHFWSPVNETARFVLGAPAKLVDPERWQTVAQAFYQELNPWSGAASWGLLWPFLMVCGVLFWRDRSAAGRPVRFLGCALLLIWTMWFVVYVCTPASLAWHLNSSLKRLLLQLTPLTLAWALAGAGRPRETTP